MKILILGDLMGNSGKKAIKENLKKIIKDRKIDFTIVNGENAAEDGKGITKDIAEELFNFGVDAITSGNQTPKFLPSFTLLIDINLFYQYHLQYNLLQRSSLLYLFFQHLIYFV